MVQAKTPILEEPAAGKTGTHQDYRDGLWVIHLISFRQSGLARHTRKRMVIKEPVTGLESATIWQAFMKEALKNTPISDFPKPSGLIGRDSVVDTKTGLLVSDDCTSRRQVRSEIFIRVRNHRIFTTLYQTVVAVATICGKRKPGQLPAFSR